MCLHYLSVHTAKITRFTLKDACIFTVPFPILLDGSMVGKLLYCKDLHAVLLKRFCY